MAEERIIKSQPVFEGRVVNLRVDTIELENGAIIEREIVQHSGAVAVVPIDEDDNVLLVEQYRAGAKKPLLELPAGGLEPGERPDVCARRELQEEVGYFPGELIRLGGYYVAASYTTEYITIFLGRDLRPSDLPRDIDEHITVKRMPFRQALEMALTNDIEDSKTLIGLMWLERYRRVNTS